MAILRMTVITATGDVGRSKGIENLRKWVENNGGKWVAKPTKNLTHLICSREQWKKGSDIIEQAKTHGAYIVTFDWLEDSLLSKRKKAEKPYLLSTLEKARRKEKKLETRLAKADKTKFEEGCKKAKQDTRSGKSSSCDIASNTKSQSPGGFFRSSLSELSKMRKEREKLAKAKAAKSASSQATSSAPSSSPYSSQETSSSPVAGSSSAPPDSASQRSPTHSVTATTGTAEADASGSRPAKLTDLYHLYMDASGFEYKILLTRSDLSKNIITRYNLQVYESHIKPHVYCTFIQFIPPRTMFQRGATPPIVPVSSKNRVQTQNQTPPQTPRAVEQDSQELIRSPLTSEAGPSKQPSQVISFNFVAPPPDPPLEPFKRLIASPNSSFATAFAVFRAAFQYLTLLAWEERQHPRTLQIERAKAKGLEPFTYARPKAGLPIGRMPQGQFDDTDSLDRMELDLPGMDIPLQNQEGAIGREVFAMEEVRKRREREEAEAKARKEEEEAKKKRAMKSLKLVDGAWVMKSTRSAKSSFFDYNK